MNKFREYSSDRKEPSCKRLFSEEERKDKDCCSTDFLIRESLGD